MPGVLVPTDGSAFAELAYPVAVSLAAAVDMSVKPLMVLDREPAKGRRELLSAACRRLVGLAAADLGLTRAPTCEPTIRLGEPVAQITEFAADAASFIVMSTHGRSGLRRWRLGSVADEVLRRTIIPAVIVCPQAPTAARPIRRLLAAVSLADSDEAVVRAALALARTTGASLTLLHAARRQPPMFLGDGNQEEMDAAVLREASAALARLVPVQARTSPALRSVIGDPVPVIAEAAADADLMVMGAHGRHGLRRWALGSVSDAVIRRSPAAVMIVPSAASVQAHSAAAGDCT